MTHTTYKTAGEYAASVIREQRLAKELSQGSSVSSDPIDETKADLAIANFTMARLTKVFGDLQIDVKDAQERLRKIDIALVNIRRIIAS